jgi:hypothetical protein
LPTMLRNLENGLRTQVLHQLQALLTWKYSEVIA